MKDQAELDYFTNIVLTELAVPNNSEAWAIKNNGYTIPGYQGYIEFKTEKAAKASFVRQVRQGYVLADRIVAYRGKDRTNVFDNDWFRKDRKKLAAHLLKIGAITIERTR